MPKARDLHAAMRALPVAGLDDILGGATPVILAPHQDDEAIGCGALIAAGVQASLHPRIVFITDGAGSHPNSVAYASPRLASLRQQEAIEAASRLGVPRESLLFLNLPDTAAPHAGQGLTDAVNRIAAWLANIQKPVLLASWVHDPHCDHEATHNIARALSEKLGCRHLSYPVWGWTLPADQDVDCAPVQGWRFPTPRYRAQRDHALDAHRSQVTGLITDDPAGFRLTGEIRTKMMSDFETFLMNP
jgi:LmbE family N-acetylglucosaminyl deacetylase